MINLAFVIGNLNKEHGGAQRLLFDICKGLDLDSYELTVYYLFGEGTFQPHLEAHGVSVVDVDADSNYDLTAFGAFTSHLRRSNHDLLQTNSPISGVWGRPAARVGGVPNVVSVEHNMHHTYRTLSRVSNGVTLPLADAVVGVSDSVTASILDWERRLLRDTDVRTIRNGVDVKHIESHFGDAGSYLTEQTDLDPDDTVVATVGRLAEQKGFRYLVRAFAAAETGDAKLLVVGDGPRRTDLERLARSEGIEADVCFAGRVPEVYPLLPAFDVAVFPSLWEGLPLAPAECMVARLPLVVTDIPPFRELVDEAGVTVPVKDATALADAIETLLESPARRNELGTRAYERVSTEFSVKRTVAQYDALYREVLGRP